MKKNLSSTLWPEATKLMKDCHLSLLSAPDGSDIKWREAFSLLIQAIVEERVLDARFALELSELSDDTDSDYSFADIFEEYFDFLEKKEDWIAVVASCNQMLRFFSWKKKFPSEYMYRKGNALLKLGRIEEAEEFGKDWLANFPGDLYAAAANVFLLIKLNRLEEAKHITEKYLDSNLVCDNAYDTFYMAAYRLYEITDDINAKQRVEQKMAEYAEMMK